MPETSAKNKQILKKLLADPANKTCADCKTTTHPRWTSWNIGVFLCIRCSGVHRSLGTHISKVRSVDLDSWSDAHLVELQRWGNKRANEYWEAGLPPNYIPDEGKIVNFIRTKYDLKRWVGAQPPAASAPPASDDVPLQQVKEALPKKSSNLLDFDDFTSAPPVPGKASASTSASADLLGGSSTTSKSASASTPARYGRQGAAPSTSASVPSATRSSVPQAPPTRTAPPAAAPSPSPSPAASAPTPRADLKKSILSLYAQKPQPVARPAAASPLSGAPTATASAPATASTTPAPSSKPSAFDFDLFTQPAPQPTSQASASKNTSSSLIDSLGGLTFDSPVTKTHPAPSPAAAPAAAPAATSTNSSFPPLSTAPSKPSFSAASSSTNVSSTVALEEDDFFANPWK